MAGARTKHLDVMISSTSQDLPEHRKEATDAVLRSGMYPVRMEDLVASDGDAISVSLQMVDVAEVYLGIFAFRYGYVPDDPRNPDRISITEMEYLRAKERGIPIRIFVMSDEHGLKPGDFENDPAKMAKMTAFKTRLTTDHVVSFFSSPVELRAQIIQSLAASDLRSLAEGKAGENDDLLQRPDDKAIIRPPELHSVPPYVLTNNFIGRKTELAELDAWATSDDSMLVVEAIGGMGKSALTWEWVQRQKDSGKYAGIFWYSFYERGAQMQDFMRHALAYLTEQPSDGLKSKNFYELQDALLPALQKKNYLLILDGLERVLVAYHRMDKAQVRDDEVQENLRDTTDPKDGRFLQKLLKCTPSRFLVSTRLIPTALEDFNGDPIKGVRRKKLAGLHPDDAYDLMLDRGVKPSQDRRQIDHFMAEFGYHGLLLTITAGRIRRNRTAPGDFDAWYAVHGADMRDPDIVQRRNKLLRYAYDGLSKEKKLLLSQIAAFGNPVEYETVALFNPYAPEPPKKIDKPGYFASDKRKQAYEAYLAELEAYKKTDEYIQALSKFDEALSELEDRGLLTWERETDTYDLHPVVRGYSFEQLDADKKQHAYEMIHNYFEQKPMNYSTAQSVSDLYNPIMVYQALSGAGRLEQAAKFYRGTFSQILLFNLAAYPTIIELLKSLFPDGIDRLPPIGDKRVQEWLINELSLVLARSGHLDIALKLGELSIGEVIQQRDSTNMITHLHNYANNLRRDNQFITAENVLKVARELANVTKREGDFHVCNRYLMQIAGYYGRWDHVNTYWHSFHRILSSNASGVYHLRYAESLFFQGKDTSSILEITYKKLLNFGNKSLITEYHELSSWIQLRQGKLTEAVKQIDHAITSAQQSDAAELASYKATLGLARARQNNLERAQELLEMAIKTNRWPLNFAHIYNCAAEVWLREGDHATAQKYAMLAYRYAWADGSPYYNWYQLLIARKHLKVLGVPHPVLLPYDESKSKKIPYEDEISAFIEELKHKKS